MRWAACVATSLLPRRARGAVCASDTRPMALRAASRQVSAARSASAALACVALRRAPEAGPLGLEGPGGGGSRQSPRLGPFPGGTAALAPPLVIPLGSRPGSEHWPLESPQPGLDEGVGLHRVDLRGRLCRLGRRSPCCCPGVLGPAEVRSLPARRRGGALTGGRGSSAQTSPNVSGGALHGVFDHAGGSALADGVAGRCFVSSDAIVGGGETRRLLLVQGSPLNRRGAPHWRRALSNLAASAKAWLRPSMKAACARGGGQALATVPRRARDRRRSLRPAAHGARRRRPVGPQGCRLLAWLALARRRCGRLARHLDATGVGTALAGRRGGLVGRGCGHSTQHDDTNNT